jgi:hypothetical protein
VQRLRGKRVAMGHQIYLAYLHITSGGEQDQNRKSKFPKIENQKIQKSKSQTFRISKFSKSKKILLIRKLKLAMIWSLVGFCARVGGGSKEADFQFMLCHFCKRRFLAHVVP